MISLDKLETVRKAALQRHRGWKDLITLADFIASDQWETAWDDGNVDASEPLVENLYSQALEDKTMTAGAVLPNLFVAPTRGTRKDRGEQNAQTRRRVMKSYWDRSRLRRDIEDFYLDHLHAGALYTMPWVDWREENPAARFPFFMKLDPRFVYPLGHNSQGDLTKALILRQRRVTDIASDWGENHPALIDLLNKRDIRGTGLGAAEFIEEIWFMDEHDWAVAFADTMLPTEYQGLAYVPNTDRLPFQGGGMISTWAVPPEPHRLFGCPISEAKRKTADKAYRGGLVDIIPQLKVAQNFMARLLDDLNTSIYAPVLMENIENPEDYSPGGILIGTGTGTAKVEYARPPVNFEAQQTVKDIVESARRQAFEPQQRSGQAGVSINSAKGTMALMGSFNAELASGQKAIEVLLERSTAMVASMDEHWCYGQKRIVGWDSRGSTFEEKYDPAKLFNGDVRVRVSYGDRTGLDEQSHLTKTATIRQLKGMSLRSFMEKMGAVDDPLQEERDIAIEDLTTLFLEKVLPAQIEQGDLAALTKFVERIDDDKVTVRAAVLEAIKEISGPQPGMAGQGPGGQGGSGDLMKMMRSMAFGGIPGNAEGLPANPNGGLRQVLGGQVGRQLAESAPGGTAMPAG